MYYGTGNFIFLSELMR